MAHIRKNRCRHCGQPHWFRYWIDENCLSGRDGLSVGDVDLYVHRFKRAPTPKYGTRTVECLMFVELKTGLENLGSAQRDSLSVANQAISELGSSMREIARNLDLKSRPGYVVPGEKKVLWFGIHLLRVPYHESPDGPFYWDNKPIEPHVLTEVINIDRDPDNPAKKLDLDRAHKAFCKDKQLQLPGEFLSA